MKKLLTRNEYYQAKGLFSLAQNHFKKCEEFEKALCELLGVGNGEHSSDAIYNGEDLETALGWMGIEIEPQDV
jgi:hypothetical protein